MLPEVRNLIGSSLKFKAPNPAYPCPTDPSSFGKKLLTLTQEEHKHLMCNSSCLKRCCINTDHVSKDCSNNFPSLATYEPFTMTKPLCHPMLWALAPRKGTVASAHEVLYHIENITGTVAAVSGILNTGSYPLSDQNSSDDNIGIFGGSGSPL
ncbi:hypothetical protein K466DRAFT_602046 [Polyporus arcularius HHB13444]|uniref:Uncharacterized protein n=1 Tax=Polyporus arcularius HHB13444 TaxID=1314778 RepID=A0A5C3P580_9APHY|nr:hypothetical protein K466DRAFT_602046 [Polyporus arcularius HHB13444]